MHPVCMVRAAASPSSALLLLSPPPSGPAEGRRGEGVMSASWGTPHPAPPRPAYFGVALRLALAEARWRP